MCFMAMYLLLNAISSFDFARILEDLGYSVELKGDLVIARRGSGVLRARIAGNKLAMETNDYGSRCLEDLSEIVDELRFRGLMPRLIVMKSPYVFAKEEEMGATRKLLNALGFDVKELYDSYCG